jgi:hypothetical protein
METTFRKKRVRHSEAGQAMVFTVLGVGIFLIGAMAFAVDMGFAWFNRQSAQTAMDLLVNATNGTTNLGGFTQGTGFDCTAHPSYSPCVYASLNGFSSSLTAAQATSGNLGNNVSVSFPANVAGVTAPPAAVVPTAFMKVIITDNIPTFFAGMLKGMTKQSVGAAATCGVVQATSPIPILVLNPTVSQAFSTQGNPDVTIVGGPSKSIQVNSSSSTAVNIGGSADVNLCAGGGAYCGSNMGVWGTQAVLGGFYHSTATCSSNRPAGAPSCGTQTAPQWNAPSAPIADPLASQASPSLPSISRAGPYTTAAAGAQGCPLLSGLCDVYGPGYYPGGIQVKNATAIFDPGIYYLQGNACGGSTNSSFCAQANSCVRPSTNTGDGSGGTIFYFADTNGYSVQVGANAGCSGTTAFNTTTGTGSLANGAKCTASSQIPSNLPVRSRRLMLYVPVPEATRIATLILGTHWARAIQSANSVAFCFSRIVP